MFVACVEIQVMELLLTQTCLGKHAFDGVLENGQRLALKQILRRAKTLTSRITGVADVLPLGKLLSGQTYFVCVEDDDVVTAVSVRSEVGFVFATEQKHYPACKTAEDLIGSINDNPLFRGVLFVDRQCFVAKCVHSLDC